MSSEAIWPIKAILVIGGDLANQGLIREINAVRCLRALRGDLALSRADIARTLKLSRMTVGNAVRSLIEQGLVLETSEQIPSAGAGRPGITVRLNPSGGHFVGLDISSAAVSAVLVDLTAKVVARSTISLQGKAGDPDRVIDHLAAMPLKLLQEAGVSSRRLTGVGVSVPGIVDTAGRVLSAPYLGWRDLDLQGRLSKTWKARWQVRVVNDAAAFAHSLLADHAQKGLRDALVILLAEGIGSSQIRDGQVVAGAHGFAGEVGHMVLRSDGKERSPLTFEMLAGYHPLLPSIPSGQTVAEALASMAGIQASRKTSPLLRKWAESLGVGLLNLIHILDPERIILGGPVAVLYPLCEERVRARIADGLVHGFTQPPIEVAPSGADSAALGAASTVRQELFALPNLHII